MRQRLCALAALAWAAVVSSAPAVVTAIPSTRCQRFRATAEATAQRGNLQPQ
jgi:hypothetical protein